LIARQVALAMRADQQVSQGHLSKDANDAQEHL
jgi:hypothetical protein